ncbi:carboxylesterase/lipase family protein [Phenylobacterium sp.]|uniref:carboxylesterase/lipase family protein n=1 Tax=Phenylobacterium sp. TaxID=1871053 RepID=UPI002DF48685|nr:carboxylesterase family protein [Phenylobacterium sp.]
MGSSGVGRRGLLTAAGMSGLLSAAPGTALAKQGGSAGASRLATPPEAIVETRSGKVRGAVRDGVFTWKGIPYGRDAGGAARFLPPQPAAGWTGVRSALSYGPVCPQVERTGWKSDETAFIYDWDDGFAGEDCLRLNVWSGGVTGPARPVMVWIHGGGYEAGSSQELPAYDGARLARRGVVFVSVNHRLGPFGFLDLSGLGDPRYAASGNAGMLDLVAALQWVRDNIAAFGGDPGNVTIFGQSGGGAKVSNLMGMPLAKGLFHKAIVESGSLLKIATPERSRRMSAALLRRLDLGPGDLSKLSDVSAAALIRAGEAAKLDMPKPPAGEINLLWGPTVDGQAIPVQPWGTEAPAQSAQVPLLVGSNLNEYSPSLGNPALEDLTEDRAKAMAKSIGGASDDAWAAMRRVHPDLKPVEVLSRLVSNQFRYPCYQQARTKGRQAGAGTWLYRFDYNPATVLDGRVRAFHCAEMAYALDNVDRCLNATGGTAEARTLAAKMSGAWLAFAHTGNPNHAGLPHWPAVTEAPETPNMAFDKVCRVEMLPAP